MSITKTAVDGIGGPVAAVTLPSISEVAAQIASDAAAAPEASTAESVNAPEAGGQAEATEAAETAAEVVEAAPKIAPAPAKDTASSRFAALSKKEKAIREQAARVDAAKREHDSKIAERERQLEARERATQEREDRIKNAGRPLDLLKAHGYEYKDATEDVLGNYKVKEADPLDSRLNPINEAVAKLAKENEELRKRVEDQDKRDQAKVANEEYSKFVDAVKKTISGGLEKYEYTAALGDDAIDIVRETMLEYYRKNGSVPDYESACDYVEDFLEKRYAEPFAKTKKFQSKVTPATATPPKAESKPAVKGKTPPKTLSVESGAAGTATEDTDKMSRAEAIAFLAKKYG
jgi:hypothetical protein